MTFQPPTNAGWQYVPPKIDATRAISYGWNKFTRNWAPWVIVTLITLLLALTVIGLFFMTVILVRGALDEVDGKKPTVGDFFKNVPWGPGFLQQLLVTIATLIPIIIGGLLILLVALVIDTAMPDGDWLIAVTAVIVIPVALVVSVVIMFLTYLSVGFVMERKAGPVGAIKTSVKVTRQYWKPLLLLAVLNELILSAGSSACYVGLLVAYPLVMISSAYAYRRVTDGPVSPDTEPYVPAQYGGAPGYGPGPGYPPAQGFPPAPPVQPPGDGTQGPKQ